MKSFTSIVTGLLLAGTAFSAPIINANGSAAGGVSDVDILQFALTLEYLEAVLYETVVTTFSDADFKAAGHTAADRDTFLQIIDQEMEHIATIQNAISMMGSTPNKPCKYNFGTVDSLGQLLNVTDAVNGLGPSAYLGAGAYVKEKMVLITGASIGNTETRHNSWLNGLVGRSEVPTAFVLPLSPTQSYGVASQFIVDGSCPSSNAPLKAVTAYPPVILITNKGYPAAPLETGATVYTNSMAKGVSAPRAAFISGFNTTIVDYNASQASAVIPSDFQGQGYIVLTTAYQGETLCDANSMTAPQAIFVDAPAQQYSGLSFNTYEF